jgi:hypothetical protein
MNRKTTQHTPTLMCVCTVSEKTVPQRAGTGDRDKHTERRKTHTTQHRCTVCIITMKQRKRGGKERSGTVPQWAERQRKQDKNQTEKKHNAHVQYAYHHKIQDQQKGRRKERKTHLTVQHLHSHVVPKPHILTQDKRTRTERRRRRQ